MTCSASDLTVLRDAALAGSSAAGDALRALAADADACPVDAARASAILAEISVRQTIGGALVRLSGAGIQTAGKVDPALQTAARGAAIIAILGIIAIFILVRKGFR